MSLKSHNWPVANSTNGNRARRQVEGIKAGEMFVSRLGARANCLVEVCETMSWPIPFKVIIPWHGCVGIVAYNYSHLRQVIAHKFSVGQDFFLQQLDGTLVCDEEYLKLLKPGTPLVVVPFTSTAGKKIGGSWFCSTSRLS